MNHSASQAIRVGAFFLLGVALVWIAFESLSGTRIGPDAGYEITARFDNLQQLRPSDDVRLAGVVVGVVESTGLRNNQAVASLRIQSKYEIPADSAATIKTAGLLGTNFLSIQVGESSEYLQDGAEIKTFETPSIDDVVADVAQIGNRMDSLFVKAEDALDSLAGLGGEDGGPGQLFSRLENLLDQNEDRINTTIANLEQITTDVAKGEGTLGKLITDPEAYNEFLQTADDIERAAENANTLLADLRSVVADVESGKGTIGLLLNDDTTADEVRKTVANIQEFSSKLNSPNSSVGRLLDDDSLYRQARETLSNVNDAANQLDDTGPITAVGVLSSALF